MSVIQENERRAPKKVELVAKGVCKVKLEEDIQKRSVTFALSCDNALQSSSFGQKRRKANDLCASGKDILKPCSTMARALELQAALSPQFPSMIKGMLQSHVIRGFWLGLNSSFCTKHMPREDTTMVLEDEDGKCYPSKYLAEKAGLSAGWRGFAIAHKLSVGDVVVFHLVTPTKFKVYISRDNQKEQVEGAPNVLKLNADTKQTLAVNRRISKNTTEDCESQPLLLGCSTQMKNSTNDDNIKGSNSDQSEHDNGDIEFDLDDDGIRFCKSSIDFNEVKSFHHFGIQANGLVITCELSDHYRRKYYDLCCSRTSFLHQHLVDGLNAKLIAGIIMETVNIADAIRASKLTNSHDDFLAWKRTLQGFERMGMDVGFLISRLDQLISLTEKSKRSEEIRVERCNALDELSTLEGNTLEMKEKMKRLDEEIMALEAGGSQLEFMYEEMARQIC